MNVLLKCLLLSCFEKILLILTANLWGDYQYISHKLKDWAEKMGIALVYIEPGNPQQNAYVERFNRTVRYDWLSQDIFETLEEVQDKATQFCWYYNNERPNMALGGITPKQKLLQAA
jgi:putative transposase